MLKSYPKAYKGKADHSERWLVEGQKVRVATICSQLDMRGVIIGVDHRFRNPYRVRLVLDAKGKPVKGKYGQYKGIELAITRYRDV